MLPKFAICNFMTDLLFEKTCIQRKVHFFRLCIDTHCHRSFQITNVVYAPSKGYKAKTPASIEDARILKVALAEHDAGVRKVTPTRKAPQQHLRQSKRTVN